VYDSHDKVAWTDFNIRKYINAGRVTNKKDAYKTAAFNQLVSDDIPMNRNIPDTRLGACPSVEYPKEGLPTTSIIITFHNELRSTLLRTIISVIRKTPANILKEIVLVDDASRYDQKTRRKIIFLQVIQMLEWNLSKSKKSSSSLTESVKVLSELVFALLWLLLATLSHSSIATLK